MSERVIQCIVCKRWIPEKSAVYGTFKSSVFDEDTHFGYMCKSHAKKNG